MGRGYKSVTTTTFERLLVNQPPIIYGDGNQIFDYVYVGDVIDATIRAAAGERVNDIFNIGSGIGTSIADLVGLMMTISRRHLPITYGERDETFGSSRVADIRKAAERLHWQPQTNLMDGLTMTCESLALQRNAGAS